MFEDPAVDSASKAMKEPLIPDGSMEPYEALQFFTHGFEARYGSMHPLFLIGSLSEAVIEATSATAASGTVSHWDLTYNSIESYINMYPSMCVYRYI